MAERKIYYKVIVRIYEIIGMEEELKISNEGFVIIEDEDFEGYLSLDYIEGVINNIDNNFSIEIDDYNNPNKLFIFCGEMDEFELPGYYILDSQVPNDNKICYLEFERIEKKPIVQNQIEQTLEEIKRIHGIPD